VIHATIFPVQRLMVSMVTMMLDIQRGMSSGRWPCESGRRPAISSSVRWGVSVMREPPAWLFLPEAKIAAGRKHS
jgi:hypothetical protein